MTPSFCSDVSLEACIQLGLWLDQRFGPPPSQDSPPSDRLGIEAGRLVAHDLVATTERDQVMVDVFAAMPAVSTTGWKRLQCPGPSAA